MNFKRIVLLGAAMLLLMAPAGCLFSPEDDPGGGGGGEVPEYDFPGTEDQLMVNFKEVYENMDIDGYLDILDPSFQIFLKQSTIDENNLPNDFFDYETDVRITRNMFSGDAPNENTLGINSVEFTNFVADTAPWEDSQNPNFEGARARTYNVNFRFEQGSGTTRQDLTVSGQIEFFLSSETVMFEGKEQTKYFMVGQVDDTQDD